MNVVCLGWGSLIWNPCCLPIWGCWNHDGPELPIEFARESADGRITLVVTKDALATVPVLWCYLCPHHIDGIEKAKNALATREGMSEPKDNIGYWTLSKESDGFETDAIKTWAKSRKIEAVVWTALKPRFASTRGVVPECEDIIDYLNLLCDDKRSRAEEYVRKAPQQIQTNYRARIEKGLGRLPTPK